MKARKEWHFSTIMLVYDKVSFMKQLWTGNSERTAGGLQSNPISTVGLTSEFCQAGQNSLAEFRKSPSQAPQPLWAALLSVQLQS